MQIHESKEVYYKTRLNSNKENYCRTPKSIIFLDLCMFVKAWKKKKEVITFASHTQKSQQFRT